MINQPGAPPRAKNTSYLGLVAFPVYSRDDLIAIVEVPWLGQSC
jgi:hypothetical protein